MRRYECPECGFENRLGNSGPQAVVDVVCGKCNAVYEVNQYKYTVGSVIETGDTTTQ